MEGGRGTKEKVVRVEMQVGWSDASANQGIALGSRN